MSDRLAELQRQRALAQEQLAWFDREIARETGQAVPASPVSTVSPAISRTASADFAAQDAAAAREAADIIAKYQEVPRDAAKDAKQGCFLWFTFIMIIVLASGAAIFLLYR